MCVFHGHVRKVEALVENFSSKRTWTPCGIIINARIYFFNVDISTSNYITIFRSLHRVQVYNICNERNQNIQEQYR